MRPGVPRGNRAPVIVSVNTASMADPQDPGSLPCNGSTFQDEFTDPCAEQSLIAAIAQDCTLYWELFDLLSPNLFTKEAGTWEQVKLAIEEGQRPVVPDDWEPTTAPHAVAHRLADLYRRRLLAALQERVAEALFDEHTPATEIATLLEEEACRVQSAFREPAMGGLLWASELPASDHRRC